MSRSAFPRKTKTHCKCSCFNNFLFFSEMKNTKRISSLFSDRLFVNHRDYTIFQKSVNLKKKKLHKEKFNDISFHLFTDQRNNLRINFSEMFCVFCCTRKLAHFLTHSFKSKVEIRKNPVYKNVRSRETFCQNPLLISKAK